MVSEKICTGSIKGDGDKRLQTPETSIEANHGHGDGEKKVSIDTTRYQKLVGKLIYLSHTRLDIAFAVSVVC